MPIVDAVTLMSTILRLISNRQNYDIIVTLCCQINYLMKTSNKKIKHGNGYTSIMKEKKKKLGTNTLRITMMKNNRHKITLNY